MKKIFELLFAFTALLAVTSCGGDEPNSDNPINPKPSDPSTNTTDVAVTGTVEETGAFFAVINGVVNLDQIGAAYNTVEIGVEWSTTDLFQTKQRIEATGVTGRKLRVKVIPLLPNTKYYYRTYVSLSSLSYDYYGETYSFTSKKMTESDKVVDLGLPSGTKWAAMNVGANSIEGYGDYFAWGETKPKSVYDWSTYEWCDGDNNKLTKYCTKSGYGSVDNKTELDLTDDAAYVNWGKEWRMPSLEQINELIAECNWKWISLNGINGQLVTSRRNSNFIFLPAAGYRYRSSLYYAGSYGYYWSRTLNTYYSNFASFLSFNSSGVYWSYYNDFDEGRDSGRSVRAVRVSQN